MLARAAFLGQIEDWDIGLRAFGKVVALDPESADAWANMASLYIKVTDDVWDRPRCCSSTCRQRRVARMQVKEKMRAYNALQEALRRRREDWRLWENMVVRTRAIVVRFVRSMDGLPSRMQFVAMGTKHYATAVHAMQVGRALNGPACVAESVGPRGFRPVAGASHLHSVGDKRMCAAASSGDQRDTNRSRMPRDARRPWCVAAHSDSVPALRRC